MGKKTTATILIFFSGLFLLAEDFDFHSYFMQQSRSLYSEAVSIRRHLHRIPELCYQETETSAYVENYLRSLGLEVTSGIAGTGIKAVLTGNRKGPVIGIRSDMDALPIQEDTGLSFSSRHPGVMHACGHDVHMTNLLITARILSSVRERIPGTVVFIFQPCEEGTGDARPSGARAMIREGVLKEPDIDAMLGLHVMPGYPPGTVALREGPIMANVATIHVEILGKGSHGAMPHQGVDAVYAASQAVIQFQSLISRRRDPNERAVLSIGTIKGGVRFNVIAEKVVMEGTVRTFSGDTENMIEQGIRKILEGLKISTGIQYRYSFSRSSKFVLNHRSLSRLIIPLFQDLLEPERVIFTDPMTVGEDFSAYSHAVPSFFFFLGAGQNRTLHHPRFTVEEEALKTGPALFCSAAFHLMKGEREETQ